MTVNSLALEDFRNYVRLSADFDPTGPAMTGS